MKPLVRVGSWGTRWYLNSKRHRADGPAVEYEDGDKVWYLNDKRHRADGPAIEYANGYKEWWLNGKQMSKKEHAEAVKK